MKGCPIFYHKRIMGIRNREGSLYMVTGIDNSGLYEGKREALGIIKTLAGEITSFDVFGGIGISAATAFAKAAKSSYDFEKEFRKNMLEVATISTQVTDDMTGFMNQVMSITQEIPIKAPEAAKALYSIVSAGHDGADGMKILEVSAKAAVGGLTETETAADAITTILNAYKMSAEEAGTVSDQLFTTVRLGKTTFGELGASIAQVAPIAAAYGISIDQVLGAVASLTKQGTPTAQAMTQIRAAIQGTAGELGDAAFQGRTFQEALQLIYEKAGGSASKMKEMLGTDEGLAATLALTGKNAKAAANDLGELQGSLGATEAAFEKMADAADNQLTLLANNVQAYLRPMGESILKEVSDIAKAFNEAFENNDIEGTISRVEALVKNAAGAFLSYKTAILLVQVAQRSYIKTSALSRLATIQHTTATALLTGALKKQAVAMLAAGKAALANPYVLAVAGVTALGYAIFKLATQATASEKALDSHNKRVAEMKDWIEGMRSQTDELLNALRDDNKSMLQKVEAYEKLQALYPDELKNLSLQKFMLMDMTEANKMLSKSIDERTMAQQRATVNSIEDEIAKNNHRISQLDKKSWIDTSFSEAFELRRLRKRNEQLKIEHDKAVEIVVQGLKARTKAEALASSQQEEEKAKIATPIDKKELEKRKKLQDELLSLRRQNQQSEIDLMKEGSEKKIAQINLDYDNEIAAILTKEKEWKDAQGGKLTKEQTVEIRTALVNSYVKRERSTSNVNKEQLEEEKRAMNEYLKEYGSYLDKRDAITALYNEKIAKATTEGEKLSLGEEMKKELAAVDDEAQKKTSIITKLFSDMSKRTVVDIRSISKEAQAMLDYINEGEFKTGSDGKGLFGLTKEQFDILSKSPEKLQAIKDEIANVNKEADQMDTSFNKVSNGLKKVFSAGDDTKGLKEGLAEIDAGMSDIMQAGQFLSDTFSKLGDAFGSDLMSGIAEGLNVAMDAVNSAMDGAKAGAMFGPIGASAGAAIGVVTSLASSIAKIHDKKNESRIQRLQDQIDTLDKSYDKLGRSIEKAYSKDASKLIDQQNKLLEQQKVLIQNQIKEEEDKKKTDNDRIKEWRDQIDEINNTIADNKEAGKDAIFGSDIKSAIDDFANAYADAWAAGEDKAQSAKDLVRKMIRNMVTESIKAAASDPMKEIREKLLEFWSDDYISDWEQDYLDRKAQELADDLDRKFGWADKYFNTGNTVEEDDGRTASSKGVGSISQDSADVIDGKMSTQLIFLDRTLVQVTGIADQMRFIYDLQTRGWKNVEAIKDLSGKVSENTAKVAEISGRIEALSEKIEANTKSAASGIKTINDKGILMRSR
ncbi:phage tail tape measure protein [Parabacteroides distasonis]|uniref:Phage tail tape measure protein n=2 Tax=Parabacteroides distasonis TaxID=823 RepID=A0A5Q8BGS6_PARDI|nr:phage tail tape measure protein [Parabacteroides distasonis]MRY57905.1 phage tail tape measure protein [Parabacteroides distasonis]MRY66312.1 phage tail tape measure protein [Parabacteroides distasonis]MRZ63226.1 phage tail tape measure protein [Parabacteroides distasonis]MSA31163.1 phage tail tape measure protein [Parabacteroides distasonis]